jgi:Helicase HerA, central domain
MTDFESSCLGTVRDVQGVSVSVSLNSKQESGLAFVHGRAYRIGQVGSFVKIPIGYHDLYGIVSQVGASAIPEKLLQLGETSHRWLTVQLVGEAARSGPFQRGISDYPTIEDEVHLVSERDLASIYGEINAQHHLVKIGHIAGSETIAALADINKLVTRHSAVVGTTGSGKSTTVAGILNQISDPNRFPSARVIVFDIHGEYGRALKSRSNQFSISSLSSQENVEKLHLPFWALQFDELVNIAFGRLPETGNARHAIQERIIQLKQETIATTPILGVTTSNITADSPIPFSLKRLWYELYIEEFGTYFSSSKDKQPMDVLAYETDAKDQPIVGDLERAIPPQFRRPKNVSGDDEKINYLPGSGLGIKRQLEGLGVLLRTPRYKFLFAPGEWEPDKNGNIQKDLPELMNGWLGNSQPISILDLSGVPSTLLNDIVGILLRILYDALFWARNLSLGGRERPLLVVMEEAHTYLNANSDGLAAPIVKKIVKEGRKYGIGAMIVSQRPSEVDPTILSQCGTFFALRLSNARDRGHITGALSDNLEGLTNMLPVLRTGEAIVLGEAVNLPMRTIVDAPSEENRPDSQDPVVCDRLAPEESVYPGGWNIKKEAEPNFEEFCRVWRQQHPVLDAFKEDD